MKRKIEEKSVVAQSIPLAPPPGGGALPSSQPRALPVVPPAKLPAKDAKKEAKGVKRPREPESSTIKGLSYKALELFKECLHNHKEECRKLKAELEYYMQKKHDGEKRPGIEKIITKLEQLKSGASPSPGRGGMGKGGR